MKKLQIGKFPPLDYVCNEAINTLCTNLSFSRGNVKKIMITSSQAGEGKTFLAMNIMRSLAKLGKSVVLVDADMRASVLNSKYRIKLPNGKNDAGLAHLLAGLAKAEDVVYKTDLPGTYIVPIGRTVPDALALLSSPELSSFLDYLADAADYVIVDAPPVGVVIDAAEIAKSCDGVIIAVAYNKVRHQELLRVKEQIQQSGCKVLGTVLNRVQYDEYVGRKYYFRSYSGHYYRQQYERKKERKPKRDNQSTD